MADVITPATTRELAGFIVRTCLADLSEMVRREGTRAFLNWVGCALGGCRHDAVAIALVTAAEFSGRSASSTASAASPGR
jgi:2-methylcitrate dehydratase PrpD